MLTGILTFHSAHNYGAMLQAYAMKKYMEKYGESRIINYSPDYIKKQYRYFAPDKSIKLTILKLFNLRANILKQVRFEQFKNTYFDLIEVDTERKFDLIWYGSDQIWNPNIAGYFDDFYFGNHNIKTKYNASYAASIGKMNFSREEKVQLKKLISGLDTISLREESSKEFLQSIGEKNIEVVLDPTLLLKKNEWREVAKKSKIKGPYILVYEVNRRIETQKVAMELADKLNIPIVEILYDKTRISYGHKIIDNIGPREFLGLFEEATYVVTSSFHGTAFSINFQKQFFTIPHAVYSTRMTDLAKKLGLESRIVTELPEHLENIDYSLVMPALEAERRRSMEFIENLYQKCKSK